MASKSKILNEKNIDIIARKQSINFDEGQILSLKSEEGQILCRKSEENWKIKWGKRISGRKD